VQHCTNCGVHDAGANFCGPCGHRFADEPAPEPAAAATTAAPGRRAAPVATRVLKSWAIASGAWLCTGWIVALLIFSSISGDGGTKTVAYHGQVPWAGERCSTARAAATVADEMP